MAIDCRALCSQDINITIPMEVVYEPKMPLKWHSCNNRGEKARLSCIYNIIQGEPLTIGMKLTLLNLEDSFSSRG